ncbi:hypothetical protein HMPREF9136_2731 [Prevotella dentalis DSM 3688]|uniref:DUF3164 family protein n=2 Tax=Prevotella dentalis (strain ATCC 49559 / DSM 3688 / JCM 13448 / NCTC 12043 / ES 2772) TaxID=908937 RepID=F9D7A3_PREDD|nr:DUF3164 family protein [Prevotella dentalis]EGQ11469.1 hypothetical protein HMPREF9136_2731 [Prevotella dentalis DSM 3688]
MEKVEMTQEELEKYNAWKQGEEKRIAAEQRKQQRKDYAAMVDEEMADAIPELVSMSQQLKCVKDAVFGNFDAILKMKQEVLGLTKDSQRSHTFTNSIGTQRITLGVNVIDGYRDTVEDGIAIVKEYIESLAKDDNSKALVSAVLRLLSRDGQGNIKASRVLQLRKMAEETGDEHFMEGVRIIEESYQPTTTKRYIRAEYKNEKGAWVNVPLGMTDVD